MCVFYVQMGKRVWFNGEMQKRNEISLAFIEFRSFYVRYVKIADDSKKNPASTATQTINARMEAYFMGKMINANSHILILNLNCKSKRTNYNVVQKLHFLHSIRFESIHFSDHYGENHWRVNALGCLNWIRNKQGMKWNGDQCKQQQRAMVSTVAATTAVEKTLKQMNYHYEKSQRYERILKFN